MRKHQIQSQNYGVHGPALGLKHPRGVIGRNGWTNLNLGEVQILNFCSWWTLSTTLHNVPAPGCFQRTWHYESLIEEQQCIFIIVLTVKLDQISRVLEGSWDWDALVSSGSGPPSRLLFVIGWIIFDVSRISRHGQPRDCLADEGKGRSNALCLASTVMSFVTMTERIRSQIQATKMNLFWSGIRLSLSDGVITHRCLRSMIG